MEEPVIPEGERSLDLRGFPLFAPIGANARRGANHPDFARLPADQPITELRLAPPTLRALKLAGISTIGELVLTPSSEVADILGSAGRTRLRGLRDQVAELIEGHLAGSADESGASDEPEQLMLDDEIGDVIGYEIGIQWDGSCPTCWSPVESTDYVTPDDEAVYRCTSCGEYFYIEDVAEEAEGSPWREDADDVEQEDDLEADDRGSCRGRRCGAERPGSERARDARRGEGRTSGSGAHPRDL